MHCSYQQISMSAERTVTTVGRPASTHLAATSARVLKGICYTEMDGVVNVSSQFTHVYTHLEQSYTKSNASNLCAVLFACLFSLTLIESLSYSALRCPALEAPQNGTIVCNRQTTGGQCSFMCDKGYTLVGTRFRVCVPSMRWSGRAAACRSRQCPSLEPPDHGFVRLPCTNEYATSCGIQCGYGYKREGPGEQFCSLSDGTNRLQWTDAPVCEGEQYLFCCLYTV